MLRPPQKPTFHLKKKFLDLNVVDERHGREVEIKRQGPWIMIAVGFQEIIEEECYRIISMLCKICMRALLMTCNEHLSCGPVILEACGTGSVYSNRVGDLGRWPLLYFPCSRSSFPCTGVFSSTFHPTAHVFPHAPFLSIG